MLAIETISDFVAMIGALGFFLIVFCVCFVITGILVLVKVTYEHFLRLWKPDSSNEEVRKSSHERLKVVIDFFRLPAIALCVVAATSCALASIILSAITFVSAIIERELYTLMFIVVPFTTRWVQLPYTMQEAWRRVEEHWIPCLEIFSWPGEPKRPKRKVVASTLILDAESVKRVSRKAWCAISIFFSIYRLPPTTHDLDIALACLASTKRPILSFSNWAVVLRFALWESLGKYEGKQLFFWGDRRTTGSADLTLKPMDLELVIRGENGDRKIRVLFESKDEMQVDSPTNGFRYRLNAEETARLCTNILRSQYSLYDVLAADRIIVNRWMRVLRYASIPIIYLLTQAAWTGSDGGLFDMTLNQENLEFKAFQLAVITLWLNLGFPRLVGDEYMIVEKDSFENLPSETRDKIILSMSCGGFRHLLDRSTGWWAPRTELLHHTAADSRKPILGMSTYDFALAGIAPEGEESAFASEEGKHLIKVKHVVSGRKAYIFEDGEYFKVELVLNEQTENTESDSEEQASDTVPELLGIPIS